MHKTPVLYNFGAGPAGLPQPVLNQIRDDIPNWYEGMSIMEISHRLPVVMTLTEKIEANLRNLLAIPEEFAVLFMHGGARTQFSAVPMNLLDGAKTADYLVTGHWSRLALTDARPYCAAHCVATSEQEDFTVIPPRTSWVVQSAAPYLHYTDNETIQGVEFPAFPDVPGKWLVSDMTSNILSKPIDFSRFGLIYASAQKNLGIAGITVVIVRKSLLGKAHPFTPPTLNYTLTEQGRSMLNTPPVFSWYVLGLMLEWAQQLGGCEAIAQLAAAKAKYLYDYIDASHFYSNPVAKAARSRVNIPFRLPSDALENTFLLEAETVGLKQLKGHKLVGGCRASIYNAMPLAGVLLLVDFMRDFAKTHG